MDRANELHNQDNNRTLLYFHFSQGSSTFKIAGIGGDQGWYVECFKGEVISVFAHFAKNKDARALGGAIQPQNVRRPYGETVTSSQSSGSGDGVQNSSIASGQSGRPTTSQDNNTIHLTGLTGSRHTEQLIRLEAGRPPNGLPYPTGSWLVS